MELDGQTIIITGASSGIGAAAAWLFTEEGADLFLLSDRAALMTGRPMTVDGGMSVRLLRRQQGGKRTLAA